VFARIIIAMRHSALHYIAFIPLLIIAIALLPLLSSNELAGWNNAGHLHLLELMQSYIKSGRLSGYDLAWFGGYPAFKLYPPLFYVLVSTIHIISCEAIPLRLLYNISIFLLPFALIAATLFAAIQVGGRKVTASALLILALFLLMGRDYAHLGLGLYALLVVGYPANFLALVFLMLLVGIIEKELKAPSLAKKISAGFLFGAIILAHTITAIFAAWLLGWYCLLAFGKLKRSVSLIALGGLLLSVWWWIPFLQNLPYSSSSPVSGSFYHFNDPLMVLFPDLTRTRLANMFSPSANTTALQVPVPYLGTIDLPSWLSAMPYFGILLLISTPFGLIKLFRERRYPLVGTYLISVLILPRDFWAESFSISLPAFRFIQPIFILQTVIASLGLRQLYQSTIYKLPRYWRKAGRITLWSIIAWSILLSWLLDFNWEHPSPYNRVDGSSSAYHLWLSDYPGAAEATQMLHTISALKPKGRVAVEVSLDGQGYFGSPQVYTFKLSDEFGIPTMPGLLAESALSNGFINPTLALHSKHAAWGRQRLLQDPLFQAENLSSTLKQLGLYNIQYIISTSAKYKSALLADQTGEVTLRASAGRSNLFELTEFSPLIESTTLAPLLFVDLGAVDFRDFAEFWFKNPELSRRRVIYSPLPFSKLPPDEINSAAGLILSANNMDDIQLAPFLALHKPIILIGANHNRLNNDLLHYFKGIESRLDQAMMVKTLLDLQAEEPPTQSTPAISLKPESIEFSSNLGSIVNYNWSPGWHSDNPSQTIYQITPSQIFVFARGKTRLFFE